MLAGGEAMRAVRAGGPGVVDPFGGERHHHQHHRGERDREQKGELLPDAEPSEHRRLPGYGDRPARGRRHGLAVGTGRRASPADRSARRATTAWSRPAAVVQRQARGSRRAGVAQRSEPITSSDDGGQRRPAGARRLLRWPAARGASSSACSSLEQQVGQTGGRGRDPPGVGRERRRVHGRRQLEQHGRRRERVGGRLERVEAGRRCSCPVDRGR